MFDLEKAIAQWRQQLAARILSREILDELESHLRDDVRAQMESGLDAHAAFRSAVQRMGEAAVLEAEFAKIPEERSPNLSRLVGKVATLFVAFLMTAGLLLWVVSGFGWHPLGYGLLLEIAGAGLVVTFLLAYRRRFGWLFGQQLQVPAEMYAPEAKLILESAGQEARLLHHNYVGTEHVLLGLLNTGGAEVAALLNRLGASREGIRAAISQKVAPGPASSDKPAPLTPRLKRALCLAVEETRASHHAKIAPAHLLLGLLREGNGVAGRVLKELGFETDRIRRSCR